LKRCVFLIVVILLSFSITYAGNFGVGVVVGEPTGLSFRLWQNKTQAFDFGVAWSLNANVLHLFADVVTHNYGVFRPTSGSMPFYYGVGVRVLSAESTNFGIRIPLGIVYIPKGTNLDFFFELVPTLELVPQTTLDVDGSFGFRYYF
jgi:hypothetical protein